MAKGKTGASAAAPVKCCSCGKLIVPTTASIPTDYVWYNGKNFCNECVAKGETRKAKEVE